MTTLMCFICGCKHMRHTGFGKFGESMRKGTIDFRCQEHKLLHRLLTHSDGATSWDYNLSHKKFKDKFGEAVQADPNLKDGDFEWKRKVMRNGKMEAALCCPEDVQKSG